MIASAAGTVSEVLPVGVIPRSAEGYRAHVNVLVHFPLVEGTMVNTLEKGDVWVSFKYNGLPSLFCSTCRCLGHARNNCNFQRVNPPVHETLLIGFGENSSLHMNDQGTSTLHQTVAMDESNVWPHEINFQPDDDVNLGHASNGADNFGPTQTMGQQPCEVETDISP
ncbi:hypothetical protein FRX31_002381 [Thalictrum thalictroides]|uniref:Zinc knuckle CX2CX4HX4C domain-containing protein n=1 Tax=Thalictrum thalictroides TaxID=46969 RepID=A0A7J6XHC6_THATH|nr:hypothetical protein FRX31_002381 [Thalictrum thalictroides]